MLAVANTESCLSSLRERQPGHSGRVSLRTSASKWRPQSWQAYSKIGMVIERAKTDCPYSAAKATPGRRPRGPSVDPITVACVDAKWL